MAVYPAYIELKTCLLGKKGQFKQVTVEWMKNLAQLGLPDVTACASPSWEAYTPLPGGAINPGELEKIWSTLISLAEGYDSNYRKDSFCFKFIDGSNTRIYQVINEKDFWQCELSIEISQNNTSQIPQYLPAAAELCRHYLLTNKLHQAQLYRAYGGLSIPPDPPLAGNRNTLIVTTQLEVEQNYDYPEAFFSAWDNIEQYGDKYLLMRGLDYSDDVSFLSHTIHHQWAMARSAKPGLTKYFLARPKPEEIPIIQTEESYLNIVGYIPSQKVVEYTCWVDPDFHIQGWEIYNIWELIQDKKLEDGSPVDTVRVIFLNREMAEREKRPLLDIGAQVWYYNPVGETEQIIE